MIAQHGRITGRLLRLYELSPDGPLTDLAVPLGINLSVGGGLLAAPLVGDRPDVFGLNRHRPNVLLRNTGNQLAIIKGVRLQVENATQAPICVAQGALGSSASYGATIPPQPKPGNGSRC